MFKFGISVSTFTLPLLTFTLPLVFSGGDGHGSVKRFVFNFSFLFVKLSFLGGGTPSLGTGPSVLTFMRGCASVNFFSILLFLFVNAVLAVVIRTSTTAVTVALVVYTGN